MTKHELRKLYREKRQPLNTAEMHELVAAMLEHFQQIAFPALHYVMSFKSSSSKLEVPVHFFEESLRETFRELVFAYPKADFTTLQMEAYEDNDELVWEDTALGFEQPAGGVIIQPQQLDLVLVPLMAFDSKGFRVGYGKGFYDRYLARCRPDTQRVGVSFFEAEPLIADTDPHDVPLTYCVTPKQLYVF